MKNVLLYLLLGIVQGITEPIPVSSSGHLVILKELFNFGTNDLNFEIIVNFGSLIAIMFIFKKDIIKLVKSFFGYIKTKDKKFKADFKYCWLIVIGVIPVGIAGILLKDVIEEVLKGAKVVGIALLITALCLYLIKNIKGKKDDQDITIKDAIFVGLFQMIALFPGISRSGATIVGAMFRDFKRDTALRFSFILYIPVSIATMVLGIKDIFEAGNLNEVWLGYLLGFSMSAILTYFASKWFMDIMKKGKLIYFVIYCLILGTSVIIFL